MTLQEWLVVLTVACWLVAVAIYGGARLDDVREDPDASRGFVRLAGVAYYAVTIALGVALGWLVAVFLT